VRGLKVSQFLGVILGAAIALIGTLVAADLNYANRNRELDIELVKIGQTVLQSDPKGTLGMRDWAIDVMQKFSGVQISAKARQQLLDNRLDLFDRWKASVTEEDQWKFIECEDKYINEAFNGSRDLEKVRKMMQDCDAILHLDKDLNFIPPPNK
jgi:hypothetical protein